MRKFSNKSLLYSVAVLVIVVAFLLLGGSSWMKGAVNGNGFGNLAWIQILIGLVIGFAIGVIYSRRRRIW